MSKTTWSEVIGSMKSDDIQRLADESGKSYFEVEKTLMNIKKESERGKAYRDKLRAQMREVKALIAR